MIATSNDCTGMDVDKIHTRCIDAILDVQPLIPALVITTGVPRHTQGLTAKQLQDESEDEVDIANDSNGPEYHLVPSFGLEQPTQQTDNGHVGHAQNETRRKGP